MRVVDCDQTDVWGPGDEIVAGWTLIITYTDDEMAALQASYDPNSGTSPSAAVSRPLVREILDAVRAATPPVPPDPQ
jgi:hypothetical protein